MIIGVYAPADDSDADAKEEVFYKLTDVNSRKQFILMGNLHGRTGSSDDFPVVGKYE